MVESPPSPPSRLRGRLGLALGATLLALAAGEVALRIALPLPRLSAVFAPVDDPDLLYEPVPGARVRFERSGLQRGGEPALVTIGDDGTRAMPPGEAGCATLWLAGDSYVFGWGVSDDQTWAWGLQERLSEPLGCRPTILNLGVGGYHMAQIEARLRRRLERTTAPSLVLVHAAANDGIPDINWASPVGIPRWATERLHLLNVINLIAVTRQYAALEGQPGAEDRLGERLASLTTMLAERSLPLWMVWQPDVPPAARLRAHPRRGETDLQPCNPGTAMHLNEDDDHYNAAGHGCIVDLLAPELAAVLGAR